MEDGLVAVKVAAYLGAAFAIGIGTIGPALGQGLIGSRAVKAMAQNPEIADKISTTAFLAMVITETSAILAFLTVMLLLFRS